MIDSPYIMSMYYTVYLNAIFVLHKNIEIPFACQPYQCIDGKLSVKFRAEVV